MRLTLRQWTVLLGALTASCGSSASTAPEAPPDASPASEDGSTGDDAAVPGEAGDEGELSAIDGGPAADDAFASSDTSSPSEEVMDAGAPDATIAVGGDEDGGEASAVSFEAGAEAGDGGLPAYRFVTGVVSFTPGPCAGFGASAMPGIVEGPPHGGGATQGSTDVVSLGVGGEIVVSFAPNAIADGPGADFIVFENPFDIGENPQDPFAEPGEVSVSEDGTTWSTYPCTATSYPYGSCAGWHPVFSSPGNGVSPVDPSVAGGDAFDLADLGLTEVRYVRIRDVSNGTCPDAGGPDTDGFDLDAVSIVNGLLP